MAQADHEGSRERIKAMKTQSSHRYALRRATFLLGILTRGLVSQAQAATVTETFDTAGTKTFAKPAGVTQLTVEVWGAGGCGGSGTSNGTFGGGGGGAYSKKVLTVNSAGENYTLVVGSGSTTSAPGGDSYFNNLVTVLAKGGK